MYSGEGAIVIRDCVSLFVASGDDRPNLEFFVSGRDGQSWPLKPVDRRLVCLGSCLDPNNLLEGSSETYLKTKFPARSIAGSLAHIHASLYMRLCILRNGEARLMRGGWGAAGILGRRVLVVMLLM